MIAKENDRTPITMKSFGSGVMPPQIVADYPIRASKDYNTSYSNYWTLTVIEIHLTNFVLSDVFRW